MKKIISLFLSLALIFSLSACTKNTAQNKNSSPKKEIASQKAEDYTPFLYKISDEDSTVWLFGSIHLGNKKMHPLPDYIMDAYEGSSTLAVECDILAFEDDPKRLNEAVKKMIYTDGTYISQNISEDLYMRAKNILLEQKTYNPTLDLYRPFVWMELISDISYDSLGYETKYGIDGFFLKDAKENNKTISEIETAEFQYDLLSSFSPLLQELLLKEAVDSYESGETEKAVKELFAAWCSGDEKKIIESGNGDTAKYSETEIKLLEEYNYKLITARNATMTEYAKNALKGNKDVFVCVGAAHVVGDNGIIDLLKKDGFNVTKVKQ